MTRIRLARAAAAVALTCALAVGGSAAAFAADSPAPTGSSSGTSSTTADRCRRADNVRDRLERALTRIQGDAQQQGSPAWLRTRADRAEKAGHADLAASLRARADRREKRVPELEHAIARLDSVMAKHCATATS